MDICSKITHWTAGEHSYLLHSDCADIQLYFVTDEIIRVRASFSKEFQEGSYVLSTTAWEDRLDFLFVDERKRITPIKPTIEERENEIVFTTKKLCLTVTKDPLCFCLYNAEGDLLYSDVPGNPFVLDSNGRVNHYSKIEQDDCFYGFGEQTGVFNKAKAMLRMSAKDAMGYDPVHTDTLYKHIPFYIKLNPNTKQAIGLFYHNFYECAFNMGREKSNYWPYYSRFQADGGDIDLFLIGGNQISSIVDHYTFLTGRPVLLPKRGLGYQGSSMYYPELEKGSDDAVLSFIDTAKQEGFPMDGFHLSSGYTSQNNKRCVFTWNHDRFQNPQQFFATMNQKGAQIVPNVKPGILSCHPWFSEFLEQEVFVKDSKQPEQPAIGKWWGGPGAFWDFTKPDARSAWKEYLTQHVIAVGTDSIWNDNCEYDSLLDQDAICDYDGMSGTIGQLKPVMSNIMCKLAHQAIVEHTPNARPYVVCRSGSAGIQKYAQTWCGDNFTSWESLQYNIATILGMGLSGCPNEGSDIGGFYGPAPEEELFVRWVQQGIFQPRFSIHSTNTDNTVTEPWMYRNGKEYIREAILLRYRMMPYLYSAVHEAAQTGAPIMRPLVYEFQDDPRCFNEGMVYLFGRDLLVANVLEKGATYHTVYLPAGCKWHDFWTRRCYEGGQEVTVPVTIGSIPLFIREGGIIPMAENQLMNMQQDVTTDLRLIISPTKASTYTLYDDDGVSNDYQTGCYRKTQFEVTPGIHTTLQVTPEGSYQDTIERVCVDMIATEKAPFYVQLEDKQLAQFLHREKFEQSTEGFYYSQSTKSILIKYNNPKQSYRLLVSFEAFDMIGI